MEKIDGGIFKIMCRGRIGIGEILIASLLLLLFMAPVAGAVDLVCSDCHVQDAHNTSCNTTTCATCHPNQLPMKHPIGPNTPLSGDLTTVEGIMAACSSCHMTPGATHPYGINLDTVVPNSYPDVAIVCGQCHGGSGPGIVKFTSGQLSVYATDIHYTLSQTASFTWALDATVSYKVNFDASASACIAGPCTYSWNFGDGTIVSSAATTSHLYPASGSYPVIVKITDSSAGVIISPAMSVTAVSRNTAPVAVMTYTQVGSNVTVHDASTDAQDPVGTMDVTVSCGNGTVKTGKDHADFLCSYSTAGTYYIRQNVMDSGGLGASSGPYPVTISSLTRYIVSGTLTKQGGTPIAGATLYLQVGTSSKYVAVSKTDGTFTFTNVASGSYTVKAIKSGLTFTNPAESVPSPIIVESSNVTGVFVRSVQ
ncbi:MAG: DUF2012 domain-containing protein [Thermodesulfovibrionales bacterium]